LTIKKPIDIIKAVKEVKMKELYVKLKGYYLKYKQIINYLIFGALTTLVNFVSYILFTKIFHIDEVLSSGLAWVVAVTFAYIVNKLFVFESKTNGTKELFKEFVSFIGCRVFSGITCDVGTFALMVKVLHINDIISKLVTQIMVIVLNYILSKVVVFRKKQKQN